MLGVWVCVCLGGGRGGGGERGGGCKRDESSREGSYGCAADLSPSRLWQDLALRAEALAPESSAAEPVSGPCGEQDQHVEAPCPRLLLHCADQGSRTGSQAGGVRHLFPLKKQLARGSRGGNGDSAALTIVEETVAAATAAVLRVNAECRKLHTQLAPRVDSKVLEEHARNDPGLALDDCEVGNLLQ